MEAHNRIHSQVCSADWADAFMLAQPSPGETTSAWQSDPVHDSSVIRNDFLSCPGHSKRIHDNSSGRLGVSNLLWRVLRQSPGPATARTFDLRNFGLNWRDQPATAVWASDYLDHRRNPVEVHRLETATLNRARKKKNARAASPATPGRRIAAANHERWLLALPHTPVGAAQRGAIK